MRKKCCLKIHLHRRYKQPTMANIIQRYDHFEPSTVILSKMKKNKNGGKTVYINAPENKKLYIQLPFMRSPFGLSAFTDEATNKTSYSLDLSFDTDNEQANDLMEKLNGRPSVLIRDESGKYTGIITPRVLAEFLFEYSERFILIKKLKKKYVNELKKTIFN